VPAYFFDSSALVKFYVEESGALWVRSFTDTEENIIHVSSLAEVETVSALTRRLNTRDINKAEFEEACDDLQQDFATQYRIVVLTEAIIRNAASLARRHGLRAFDAVQLAAALETSSITAKVAAIQLTVVSADAELNAAAMAEGLNVEDPNTH
jgi:predicted nucleic acid-binding protein